MKKFYPFVMFTLIYIGATAQGFIPNDSEFTEQWYLEKIGVPEAWNITMGSEDIIVATIGFGMYLDHSDLFDDNYQLENIYHNPDEEAWDLWEEPTDGNDLDDDNNGKIDDWKGWNFIDFNTQNPPNESNNVTPECNDPATCFECNYGMAVAGIIGAHTNNGEDMAGIAGGDFAINKGGVKVLPLKIFGWRDNQGSWELFNAGESIYYAIEYAVDMGADIIDLSWGWPSGGIPPLVKSAIENGINYAYSNDVLVVAPAGSNDNFVTFPGFCDHVISVGATDENDVRANFSSHGTRLDLMAPGTNILSLNDNSIDDTYHCTTFSSAIVSATAALMLSVNSTLLPSDVERILYETAVKVGDEPYINDWNYLYGHGRVNTYEAVCKALEELPQKTVSTNESWNDPVHTLNNITVQAGNTLTITSTVYFGPDATLIIEQGAKVIVDGGTLTNYKFCGYENEQWKGVEVWGDESEHQYTINGQNAQGQLELINGATIENAVCAVELWKPSDYSTTGGIVVADSAFFINNAKSVHGLFYTNYNPGNPNIKLPNKSSFINCVFEINHNYIPSNTFYKHIDLAEVNGFEFYGCDFSCENSSGVSSATMGIASYGSRFGVHSRCSSICTPCPQANIDRSTFTGFYQGIYQTNGGAYSFVVDDAVFSNNEYGINVNGTDHFVVLNSTFNIGQNVNDTESCASTGSVPSGYGIYSMLSNGFIIEDNTFTKQQGAPPKIYTGICIDNAEQVNEITNNSFDHLYYGNLTKHLNYRNIQATEGLCYYCNDNTYNVFDFMVMGDGDKLAGIQSTQGSLYRAAGNTFSPTALWHFYNDGIPHIGYYSYAPGSLEDPDDWKLHRVTDHENNPQNPCNDHYNSAKSTDPDSYNLVLSQAQLDSALNGYVENEMNLNTVSQLYESLEDGGDTPATLTDIETAIPMEMWDLRTELLGKSPHLSNEALKKITDRTDVFPDDILLEILMSNPDELRNKKLIEYIENSPDPLPDYMIDLLKQAAASSNTYKTFLNQQKSFYGTERVRHANDIIRSILFDTTINMNTYRNWLDNIGGETSDINIIESYVHEGNYTDAMLLASTLPVVYNYNEQQQIEHNYFLDMIEFKMALDSTNRNMMMLDSTELSYLNNIAENSIGRAGVYAKGILKALFGYRYCNCVDVDSSLHLKYSNASMPVIKNPIDFSITISPNPASTWTNIEYTLPPDCHKADMMIFDQYGREVEILQLSEKKSNIVWDTRTLEKGVYIYKVSHGETTLSGKIVIN